MLLVRELGGLWLWRSSIVALPLRTPLELACLVVAVINRLMHLTRFIYQPPQYEIPDNDIICVHAYFQLQR